jgi:ketosteroid isomerase-like protein
VQSKEIKGNYSLISKDDRTSSDNGTENFGGVELHSGCESCNHSAKLRRNSMSPAPASLQHSDDALIRELIETRLTAIRRKDVDRLLASYAPEVVTFNLAPPLQTIGTNRKDAQAWMDSYEGPIECQIQNLQIMASGDVAFAHYLIRTVGQLKIGRSADMWFRATLGLRKAEAHWLVVHEHQSEPIDMTTFKAIFDLKP